MSNSESNPSLLARLDATPAAVGALRKPDLRALISFLLRWEAWTDALTCLDLLAADETVSSQDARAQALTGLGRHAEATAVMAARVEQRDSATAQVLRCRTLLQAGDAAGALALATQMSEGSSGAYGPVWSLLGDVHLAAGRLDAAEAAFLRHQELSPNSRQPAIGLAQVALRRGRVVDAAAYAARAGLRRPRRQPGGAGLRAFRRTIAPALRHLRSGHRRESADGRARPTGAAVCR